MTYACKLFLMLCFQEAGAPFLKAPSHCSAAFTRGWGFAGLVGQRLRWVPGQAAVRHTLLACCTTPRCCRGSSSAPSASCGEAADEVVMFPRSIPFVVQDNATMLQGQLEQQSKAVDTIIGNMRASAFRPYDCWAKS